MEWEDYDGWQCCDECYTNTNDYWFCILCVKKDFDEDEFTEGRHGIDLRCSYCLNISSCWDCAAHKTKAHMVPWSHFRRFRPTIEFLTQCTTNEFSMCT